MNAKRKLNAIGATKRTAVWEFRWRELTGNGKRVHRRIVLGSVGRLVDEAAARQAVAALCIDINAGDVRIRTEVTTVSQLAEHYKQRELRPDTVWKTYSTKVTYEGYLNKWILPVGELSDRARQRWRG